MKTSSNGRQLIEQFEGLFLKTYNDGTGVLTIGYGHTSSAGSPKVVPGLQITRDQADQILSSDLARVEAQVANMVKTPLNQNQFDALVSFTFNLGPRPNSTLIKKINANDFQGAADEFAKWNRAGGKVLLGLTRRRAAERQLFLKPVEKVAAPTVKTSTAATAATATVVAGTAAASQHVPIHWYWIAGVAIGAVVLIEILHWLFRKKTNVTNSK